MADKKYLQWGVGFITLVVTIASAKLFDWHYPHSSLIVLIIPALVLAYHYRSALNPLGRAALVGFILAIIVAFGFQHARLAVNNIQNPPEFDIQQFWLHARVANQGLNFYEPEHARSLGQTLFNPSEGMMREFYFWYPPPSMIFFGWLGWFDVHTATALWYIVEYTALLSCIILLWKAFTAETGWLGFIWTAALVVAFRPVYNTFLFGQVNFITLLMLLLFWRDQNKPSAGLWLAIGIFSKPYIGILGLYLLLRRKWTPFVATFVAGTAICIITMVIFGPQTFFTYFTSNPTTQHMENLTIPGATSLAGLIFRLNQGALNNAAVLASPFYLAPVLLMLAFSIWLVWILPSDEENRAMVLLLPLGLWIYPLSGDHYAVTLLLSFLLLWFNHRLLPAGIWLVTAFVALEYFLFHRNYGTAAILLNWVGMAAVAVWLILRPQTTVHRVGEPVMIGAT